MHSKYFLRWKVSILLKGDIYIFSYQTNKVQSGDKCNFKLSFVLRQILEHTPSHSLVSLVYFTGGGTAPST